MDENEGYDSERSSRGPKSKTAKRSFGYNKTPREMHKVTCADCSAETDVPFKPNGTRPVYCRDCYQKRRPKRY
ncbi:MAG: hypothetical protein BME93_01255 [Methanosarcinales archaeon Met12]|nr:MAG: hypothetical protein BME93_01255 [Methanosarcinales archaeon Met12]